MKICEGQKEFLDFLTPLGIEARYPIAKERLLTESTYEKSRERIILYGSHAEGHPRT
jgi:hypothetical protein